MDVLEVGRDRMHPLNKKAQAILATRNIIFCVFSHLIYISASVSDFVCFECVYLGSGIMMGSSSSSSLCWTRSGSSHTLLWSISIMSRSNWNSFGMEGWEDSLCWVFWRAWLDGHREGRQWRIDGGDWERVYLVHCIINQCLIVPVPTDTTFY